MATAKKAVGAKPAAKKPAAPKATGMSGGKLEKFTAGDSKSKGKFEKALKSGKVGSMGHPDGKYEKLK